MKEIWLLLEDLDCANCAAKIEHRVEKLPGVTEASVSFATKKLYAKIMGDADRIKNEIIALIHDLEPEVSIQEIGSHENTETMTDSSHSYMHGQKKPVDHPHAVCDCDASYVRCNHEHLHEHTHSHDVCHDHQHHEHHHDHCDCVHPDIKKEQILYNAIKLQVANLDCASCAQKVEDAIAKADHISAAALNFSTSILFVKTDNEEEGEHLVERLQKIAEAAEPGVVLSLYEGNNTGKANKILPFTQKKEFVRLGFALILFLIGELLTQNNEAYGFWVLLGALLFSGAPIILKALRNIMHGEIFDENFLMSLASIGAFVIGEWGEGCAVMIFYEIGELCQAYAVNRSRKNIADLMDIKAEYANLLVDGKEERIAPKDVHVNDVIIIRAGERVALDGVVIQGESALDTSALTGESLPRDVSVEDEILAGSVNLNGVIQVRVTKELQESTVSRILELVENAGSRKAPIEKFITKFARIYTPVVVALALLLLLVPMVVMPDAVFYDWLYRALTFLVVSCPCALVVSIPLALFAGIGGAGRRGILIKGGNYLEALSEVDTVVFDKTGTLTKGAFHVESIKAVNHDADALLELGAYGEAYSNHPIARSIMQAYDKEIDQSRISDYEELAGNGIRVRLDGELYYLGNHKLMQAQHISYERDTPLGTIVHIAKQDAYLGYIVINDEIKPTAAWAITSLKQEGVTQCVMLSGDRSEVAEAVGKSLGLDQVYGQLLPQDKVEKLEELLAKEKNGKLAFVGDGINDAPVLARADLGVAMGGIGSDAAIEAADIVLMKDDPKALAEAIRIAKKTKRILWQNIIFSLGVKIAVLILTVFAMSTMWMGVFADVGVTLLAVLNSMRALKAADKLKS